MQHFLLLCKFLHFVARPDKMSGGARRDRTADLLHAMQALSQLSYSPTLLGGERSILKRLCSFVKENIILLRYFI